MLRERELDTNRCLRKRSSLFISQSFTPNFCSVYERVDRAAATDLAIEDRSCLLLAEGDIEMKTNGLSPSMMVVVIIMIRELALDEIIINRFRPLATTTTTSRHLASWQ